MIGSMAEQLWLEKEWFHLHCLLSYSLFHHKFCRLLSLPIIFIFELEVFCVHSMLKNFWLWFFLNTSNFYCDFPCHVFFKLLHNSSLAFFFSARNIPVCQKLTYDSILHPSTKHLLLLFEFIIVS